jgi:hypothetical protein
MKIFEVTSTPKYMYHVTPKKNLRFIKKEGLVPQTGANSALYGETENKIYLFPSIDDAENAVMNWLGDLYDEDIALALLQVDVSGIELGSEVGYEQYTLSSIPPDRIKVLSTDF